MLSDIDSANNLVELFLKRADQRPDRAFLGAKLNGEWQTITWGEAAEQVCLLAENLRKLGLKPGDRVCLVSENRPEWCIAMWGIRRAEMFFVPVNWHLKPAEVRYVLENSDARGIITSGRLIHMASDAAAGLPALGRRSAAGAGPRGRAI